MLAIVPQTRCHCIAAAIENLIIFLR